MSDNWGEIYKNHNIFIINNRWAIRDNSLYKDPAVIVHKCTDGTLSSIYDLARFNYKCNICDTPIPDEVQAVWLLRTCDNHDKHWMKDGRIGE